MNTTFDRNRYVCIKKEILKKTEYPDLQRAADPNDMNVSKPTTIK